MANKKKTKALEEKVSELEEAIREKGVDEGDTVAAIKYMAGTVLATVGDLEDTVTKLQRKVKRLDNGGGNGGNGRRNKRRNNDDDSFFDSDLIKAVRAMSLDAMYSVIEQFDREVEKGPQPFASMGYTGPTPYRQGVVGNEIVDLKINIWFFDKQVQKAAIDRQRTAAIRMEALVALFNNGMNNKRESGSGSFLEISLIMSTFNPAGTGSGSVLSSLTGGLSIVVPAEDAWRKR